MAKPPPRLFTTEPLTGGAVRLSKSQAHYLGTVLRLETGAEVLLFGERDGEWAASITELSRKGGAARPVRQTRPQAPGPDLTLLFAPLKKTPTDLVVRMGTELGVRRFVPVLTARTQAGRVNTERLGVIATEAAEQSERLDVPVVAAPLPLADALADAGFVLFCDEAGAAAGGAWGREALPGAAGAMRDAAGGAWSVLTGPEGGFTDEERAGLRARPGTLAVSLGPRILKAETAAVAALTLWQATLGDLSGG